MHKIFISGAPRSGTTLMQGIICGDEKTFPMTEECYYLTSLLFSYAQGKALWDDITYDYFDHPKNFMYFNKQIMSLYTHYVYSRFGKDKIYVQKDAGLLRHVPELDELFPDECLFIVMLRDPRDVCASHLSLERHEGMNIEYALNGYINSYENFMNYYDQKQWFPNVMFVKYEDLLTDTDKVMSELRDFTGLKLDFDPKKDNWEYKRGMTRFSSELDGKPIDPKNIGKHKEDLSMHEIEYVDDHKEMINEMLMDNVFFED